MHGSDSLKRIHLLILTHFENLRMEEEQDVSTYRERMTEHKFLENALLTIDWRADVFGPFPSIFKLKSHP